MSKDAVPAQRSITNKVTAVWVVFLSANSKSFLFSLEEKALVYLRHSGLAMVPSVHSMFKDTLLAFTLYCGILVDHSKHETA